MRRIYKTTTALATCLSLIAPQLAVAQDDQDTTADEQAVLSNDQPAEPQEAAEEVQEATPTESTAVPEDTTKAASEQPQGEAAAADQPEDAQALPEQAAPVAPPAKPEVTQAKEPAPKPPVVQAQEPVTRPETAPATAEGITGAQPEPKPDNSEAVTAADPAPNAKPSIKAERAMQETSAETTEGDSASKTSAEQSEQDDEPQLEPAPVQQTAPAGSSSNESNAEAAGQSAPDPNQSAEPRPTPKRTADSPSPDTPDAPELEHHLQQQVPDTNSSSTGPKEAAAEDEEQPNAKELEERLKEQTETTKEAEPSSQASKDQPASEQTTEVEAPEARVEPNALAQRAAEKITPPTATALSAGDEEEAGKGEAQEVQITKDNARSSAEDFATSVAEGLQAQPADPQPKEARDDDNDNDIAKLLLAGAAGFAVGKMLSNDRQVALNTGDRVVVTLPDGSQQVIKDDNALLYQPGSNVRTETFDDGSTRTTVLRADGSRVVTIRDADMNILRRTLLATDGTETRLIDDTEAQPVQISTLPAPPPVRINHDRLDEAALRDALYREASVDRRFSLSQVRDIPEVRALVAPVNLPQITFDTGSAAITPDQAQELAALGKVIRDSIGQNPREIYLIEGYTDAIGSDAANLALSDRRAESVALALTEYFEVPPENMVVQGYGEQFLLIPTTKAERQNRRVAVRRITDLLAQR